MWALFSCELIGSEKVFKFNSEKTGFYNFFVSYFDKACFMKFSDRVL